MNESFGAVVESHKVDFPVFDFYDVSAPTSSILKERFLIRTLLLPERLFG
jgi:hypothetical protein